MRAASGKQPLGEMAVGVRLAGGGGQRLAQGKMCPAQGVAVLGDLGGLEGLLGALAVNPSSPATAKRAKEHENGGAP